MALALLVALVMRESLATFAALATLFASIFLLSHADPRSRLSMRPGVFAGAPVQPFAVDRCGGTR